MSNKKTKKFSSKIKYDSLQDEYVLQLKQKCKWCWLLLLLLLPLLLLIPLQKDVSFKVLDAKDNSVVSGLNVNFDYTKRDLFNFETIGFFTRIYPYPNIGYYSDTTDATGIVTFKDIKYNVYQWIFRNNDITRTHSNTKCLGLDTTIILFDLKGINTVYVHTFMKDVEFTVVDADDNNEPLPNALVVIDADMFSYKDSIRSDAAGKIVFRQVPYCSNIKVIASKYGWYNDTITGKLKDHENDTLFLKQEKVIVKFFVKDINTKKPLVNAHGQLFFKNKPTLQVGNDAITNINGVAKGVFNNVHKIRKMRIDINKNSELVYYNDTSTLDYIPWIKVETWKRRNDNQKIIYLRPKPKPIVFQNIDCKTKKGIGNVENEVSIIKANGTKQKPTTITSDKDGNFSVSSGIGDKITIKAKSNNICPDEYLQNTTTIVNALYDNLKSDANKRKIPLCKKEATKQKFRNVDANNPTKGIVGATNKIIIKNGSSFTIKSGAGGWFEIDKVYACQIITIKANGTAVGYGTNNTKVKNKLYANVMSPNAQNLRNIPLRENTIKVKFCDVAQNGNVITGATNEIYINGNKARTKSGGCFYVEALPNDKIKIIGKYKGQVNDTKVVGNKTLNQLKSASQNDRNIPFKVIPPPPPCNEHKTSGGDGITIDEYDMLNPKLQFTVSYDMYTEKDQIIIYCGRKNNIGKVLYQTPGKVGGTGTARIDLSRCSSTWITIKIIGGSGTSWDYKIECD